MALQKNAGREGRGRTRLGVERILPPARDRDARRLPAHNLSTHLRAIANADENSPERGGCASGRIMADDITPWNGGGGMAGG